MKISSILALGTAFAVSATNAMVLDTRDTPGVVTFSLFKSYAAAAKMLKKRNAKRSGEVGVTDTNYQKNLLYVVEVLVGTPPQSTFVQLDTGSSDLVLETDSSDICSQAPPNPCTMLGACK